MKRLSLLRKIAAISAPVITVAPIVFTITSCAPKSMVIDCYDLQSVLDYEGGEAPRPKQANVSFKTLLYGSRSLHNGNYIVFVGSNIYDSVCKFFTNNEQIREKELWYDENYFTASALYKGITGLSGDDLASLTTTDIGIYNFIEFFDHKFYDKKGHEIVISDSADVVRDNLDPYEEWNKDFIEQTYAYNKSHLSYEWDKKSVKEGEKIRRDTGAQCLRAFNSLGAQLYPKKEESSSNEGERERTFGDDKGQIAFFQNGKLKAIEAIPMGDKPDEKFKQWILDYFKKEEPESHNQK